MFLANFMDLRSEKKLIQKYFRKMDRDRDGELSFDELVSAYHEKVGKGGNYYNYNFLYLYCSYITVVICM